jgi:malic enzyme
MSAINARPVIFALSNPTSKAECTAEQAYAWSKGKAVFSSGSPFGECMYEGRVFRPGQGNNAYVFPGIGLGVVAALARRIPEAFFLTAARTLASSATRILPRVRCIPGCATSGRSRWPSPRKWRNRRTRWDWPDARRLWISRGTSMILDAVEPPRLQAFLLGGK